MLNNQPVSLLLNIDKKRKRIIHDRFCTFNDTNRVFTHSTLGSDKNTLPPMYEAT